MNKMTERKMIDAVYGNHSLRIEGSERPDFKCSGDGIEDFGIEVTEFFNTESDARLLKIPKYAVELIKSGNYRHKDDIDEIPVKDVVYHVAATGQKIPLKGILRPVPTHSEVVQKCLAKIIEKNGKHTKYNKSFPAIDLIVGDTDSVMRFSAIQELLEPIFFSPNAEEVIKSPYREIYVITRKNEIGKVGVPLRGNLFLSETLLFTKVYQEYQDHTRGANTVGEYLQSLAKHLVDRFPMTLYRIENDDWSFMAGTTAWKFTYDQNIAISDMTYVKATEWSRLAPDVEEHELPLLLAQMVDKERKKAFACYDKVYIPIGAEEE